MKLNSLTSTGEKTTLTAPDQVFAAEYNSALLAQAIRVYLANERQGSAKVKTRGEVARTKKKWFKQKGTGNARHGARTPSLFVGGGVAHGPNGTQNWSLALTQTMKRQALCQALSRQAENIIVCDSIEKLDGKTATAVKVLKKIVPTGGKILVILSESDERVMRGLRNLQLVWPVNADRLNVLHVAGANAIIMTSHSVKKLTERLTAEATETEAEAPAEVIVAAKPTAKVAPKKTVKTVASMKKEVVA
jgi:large subunit ribosomal protein L4